MSQEEGGSKGQIVAEYLARCGVCHAEFGLDARKRRLAVEEVRQRGWRHTLDDGWVCPRCLADLGL